MLSKTSLLASVGLMAFNPVEANFFQDFIPHEFQDFIDTNLNQTITDSDKFLHDLKHESHKIYRMGEQQLKDAAQDFEHNIENLKPENWKATEIDKTDPDFHKSFQEIVLENGLQMSSYPVTTEDGYILNVFRITSKDTKPGAKVVFLMHGIIDSADCWIMHKPDLAPAFQLVKQGYDVWLGNSRGTKYSLGHKTLSTKDKKYWEFSWTEMGDYDALAQVDYIRKHTGSDKVTYIGHSQGTTQMFYQLATKNEEWKERLNLFVALAPVTRIDHTKSKLFQYLSQFGDPLRDVLYALHVYHLLDGWQSKVMQVTCKALPPFCQLAEAFFITSNPLLDDPDRFNVYMGHIPSGASVQSFIHYAQVKNSAKFQLYDWGSASSNQDHYNMDFPPEIDLGNIKGDVPVAMFVGTDDDLGDLTDERWARETIDAAGNAIVHYEEVKAGHATFMIGKDMYYFQNVLDLVKKYNI